MVNVAAVQPRFFPAEQPPACIHNSMVARCTFTISQMSYTAISEKGCRKKCAHDNPELVIWDMPHTLFQTLAVEPTFVAFL